MSSTPSYRYSTRVEDQPVDAAGRRWITRQLVDAAVGAADGRAELLAFALFSSGGIVLRPTLSLTDPDATLTGPILGITSDGLAPLLVDAGGAGVTLALDELGTGFADGTHAIILKGVAVTTSSAFTSPDVPVRDSAGNVVETTAGESLTYQLRTAFGELQLKEGTTIADDEVLVATVTLSGGVWSALTEAGAAPTLRARLEDVADVDTTGRLDGYLLSWDASLEKHVYVAPPPGTGSGS
jgi:hypothetical protein